MQADRKATSDRRRLLRWLGWFILANAAVLALVALRYLSVADVPPTPAARAFAVAMYLGHFSSMDLLVFLPLLLMALLWPARRLVMTLAMALAVFGVVLLTVDTFVYQQYRFHLNAAVMSLVFGGAADEIFVFSWTMYLEIALCLALVLGTEALLAWALWHWLGRGRWRGAGYALSALLVMVFVGGNLAYAYADAVGYSPIMRLARLMPLYQPLTAKGFLADHGFDVVADQAMPAVTSRSAMHYPLEPLTGSPPPDPPNIVFIVIESWRFDSMSKRITPHIAALAEDNLCFMNHWSGGNATRMGMFSLFYGIPGTYWSAALSSDERPALMQLLQRDGYDFGIFGSADLTSPPLHRVLFSGIPDLRLHSDGDSVTARDRDITRDFKAFLAYRKHDKPFFSLLFYDSPHAYARPENSPKPFQPESPPVNYLTLDADTDPTALFNRYKNSLYFVDSLVGRALAALRSRGLMDRTIVVVTGDHGQEFNDTGQNYWGHNGNFSRFQAKVPFVLHWPGRGPGRVDYLTSHFDVAPTLMQQALGVDNAFAASSVGNSLFAAGDRDPLVISEYRGYGVRTGDGFVEFPPFGGVSVYTRNYVLRPDAQPPPGLIKETLHTISRFYAR